jgi:hypothetical protein
MKILLMVLPQEYWMERTIRAIASVVGTPLVIDNATTKRLFDHYARVLVYIDFSKKIFHEIMVESERFAFGVEVAYEWLPDFCSHCQTLGHDVTNCCWLYLRKEGIVPKENVTKGKAHVTSKKLEWVPVQENLSGIGSSKTFAAPTEPSITVTDTFADTPANVDTVTNTTESQTHLVADEVPQGTLSLRPMLELNHVVHDDVLSNVEEHVSLVIREELGIPRIQDAHVTNTSLVAHDDVQLLTVDLDSPTFAREDMQTQHFVAHDDVQASPHQSSCC